MSQFSWLQAQANSDEEAEAVYESSLAKQEFESNLYGRR